MSTEIRHLAILLSAVCCGCLQCAYLCVLLINSDAKCAVLFSASQCNPLWLALERGRCRWKHRCNGFRSHDPQLLFSSEIRITSSSFTTFNRERLQTSFLWFASFGKHFVWTPWPPLFSLYCKTSCADNSCILCTLPGVPFHLCPVLSLARRCTILRSVARLHNRTCSQAVQQKVQPGCRTSLRVYEKGTTLQAGCTRGSAARL